MENSARTVIDPTTMQRVGGLLGSNPAGVYQDSDGQRYYVKTLESVAHARNEFIAAQLYQLCGVPTLSFLQTTAPDQIASQWLSLDKKCVAHFSAGERKQAQRWFGVHAWMANWDVAGYNGDNQGTANGIVLTLDVGGALNFRAQGDPKGKAFGTSVNELDVLRSDRHNPHAMKLFADMSLDELKRAIAVVVMLPDAQIHRVIVAHGGTQALADKMLARKADMARRFMSS